MAEIHSPFRRIHLIMYALTVATVGAPLLLLVTAASSPQWEGRLVELTPGLLAIAGICFAGIAIYWALYLVHQRTMEVAGEAIEVRSWISVPALGTALSLPLASIRRVRVVSPYFIEFIVAGDDSGSDRAVRVGTFWWRRDDYEALLAALDKAGKPREYRHSPSLMAALIRW